MVIGEMVRSRPVQVMSSTLNRKTPRGTVMSGNFLEKNSRGGRLKKLKILGERRKKLITLIIFFIDSSKIIDMTRT